jgi:DNA-binding SARP family transcriptional activator
MLEVRLLGTFDVRLDGRPITLSSRTAQSLFAYLIMNAGVSHRREKLAGLLWPASPELMARDNLRHALWRIRKALSPNPGCLTTDAISITFNSSADFRLDVSGFLKVREDASIEELKGALCYYQGELLPGFYDDWILSERELLDSIYEHKMAHLIALLQREHYWLDILDWGERWIILGQKPEPAYRALMSAHAAKGNMSRVATTYDRCVKSLMELGMEPSEETRRLYQGLKTLSGGDPTLN